MPSTLIGAQSGGVNLISGTSVYSGLFPQPRGVQMRLHSTSSGSCYVGCSGNITITSGGYLTSGGYMDGWEIRPSDGIYNMRLPPGGVGSIFATVPAATSGFVRLNWEIY